MNQKKYNDKITYDNKNYVVKNGFCYEVQEKGLLYIDIEKGSKLEKLLLESSNFKGNIKEFIIY